MVGDLRGGHLEYVVRGTHRTLVRSLPQGRTIGELPPSSRQGLVVVPVSRHEPHLQTPARIAADLGWPLLLLCSHGNQARRARALVAELWPDVTVLAVDLLDHRSPPVGQWATSPHWAVMERAGIDTNRKRNLGLAVSRMAGISWVMFVDDDLLWLPSSLVIDGLGHLDNTGGTVVGWPAEYFPDNSVVHHARRDFLNLNQDVFIGGGAMLIRVEHGDLPGFPPMYNEDWLFLFELISTGRVLAGPDVGHLAYDPYADPQRARLEEFGDVLGEGLYHLLHEKEPIEVALEARYWRSVHAKRTKLLRRITAELRDRLAVVAAESEQVRFTRALAAMDESRKQLTRATPESLADFVHRWRYDDDLWRKYVARLPRRETVKDALVYLGLHESWIVTS